MSKPEKYNFKIKFKIFTCNLNTIVLKRSYIAQRVERFNLSQRPNR